MLLWSVQNTLCSSHWNKIKHDLPALVLPTAAELHMHPKCGPAPLAHGSLVTTDSYLVFDQP